MRKIIFVGIAVTCMSHSVMANVANLPASWTGIYNDEQKISLFFKQNGAQISGYSLLNGKAINFTGSLQSNGKLSLKEQGTGNSVGVFNFQYVPASKEMEGSWTSANGKVKPKFFSIQSQQCSYAKNAGSFPQTSQRLLKDADLQMSVDELQYMRNEIYARHGYAFANKDWAITFSAEKWYMPCYTNVENRLTSIEKQNIKRIKAVEPYAKKLDWGR